MRTRLLHFWDILSSGYWFVPAVMGVSAGFFAIGFLWVDRHWHAPAASEWIYTGGAAGARSLLSTVAGSVITVAGVVFSITIATLTQASSQFGPRLLRNFMRDRGNQIVLGTFVATFLYCLLILRAVRGADEATFVPNVSITFAVLMAVGSLAVLIYFIDHISRALQGPQVVAAVGRELQKAVKKAFPQGVETWHSARHGDNAASPRSEVTAARTPVFAADNGYLQAFDGDGLLEIAKRNDSVMHLACRPGDYIIKGSVLLMIEGLANSDEAMQRSIAALFILGRQRTAEQDLEYSIRQLAEIAVRALSPGINDPFTAMNCIDWLGAAIGAVAKCGLPSPYRCDKDGICRVVGKVSTFAGFVGASFNQIRQFGSDSVSVSLRLLEAMASAAQLLVNDDQRSVLRHHAEMVHRQSREKFREPSDLDDLETRFQNALAALQLANPRASSRTGKSMTSSDDTTNSARTVI
jgi:uncharacterized membrane protein